MRNMREEARVVVDLSKTNVGRLTKEWRERAGGVARGENLRARREPTARRNMIASSFAFSSISFALVSAAASIRFDSRVPLPTGTEDNLSGRTSTALGLGFLFC
jgi:hypothetical protein